MGGPDARGDPGGMLCPRCFTLRAEAAGIVPTAWVVQPEQPFVMPTNTPPHRSKAALRKLCEQPWLPCVVGGHYIPDGYGSLPPGQDIGQMRPPARQK